MSYSIFEIQCTDLQGAIIQSTGGQVLVCVAGQYVPATLYNPDADFAALSNPVSMTRGRARFAIATGVAGQTTMPVVDLYGVAPGGQAFQRYSKNAAQVHEIMLDLDQLDQVMVAPFSFASGVATEVDTGLNFPVGALVGPDPWVDVKAIDATETIDVGLLSSESGGDADGFLDLLPVDTLGVTKGQRATTATVGALLIEAIGTTPAVNLPRSHEVTTAVSLTWTLTTGSDTGLGRIGLPYRLAVLG